MDQFPEQVAQAICAKLSSCYGPPAMPVIFGDADCATLLKSTLLNATFAPAADSVAAGKIKVDPAKVGQCLADFAKLECGKVSADFPEACRTVLEGKVSGTTPCAHKLECAPGNYCDLKAGCGTATCKPFGKATEPCSDAQPCAAGLGCVKASVDAGAGTCVPLAKLDAECKGASQPDCEIGLLCWGGSPTVAGHCLDPKGVFTGAENDLCSSWTAVFGDGGGIKLCKAGNYCDVYAWLTPNKCLPAAIVNAPCEKTLPDQCPSGQYCEKPSAIKPTACLPMPANGEDCAAPLSLKGRCAAYHVCDGKTCRLLRNNGEACSLNFDCYSGFCDSGAGKSNKCLPAACPIK